MAEKKISQFPAISGSQISASVDFIPIVRWNTTVNTGSTYKITVKEFFNSTNSLTEKTSGFANSNTFIIVTSGSSPKKLSLNKIILTSSYAYAADTANTSTTANFSAHAQSSNTATSSSYATRSRSSSYVTKAVSSDTATSSSYATRTRSSSYATKAATVATPLTSASYATRARSSSYATTVKSSSYATTGAWAVQSTTAISASYAANIIGGGGLTTNTTVNFNSSMTTTQMQTLIDAQPRMLNQYSLTFQFADGTYNLTAPLTFSNFSGDLRVYGNAADFSAGTSKNVYIAAASGQDALRFYACNNLLAQGLKIGVSGANNAQRCITCDQNASSTLYYNYFTRTDNSTTAASAYLILMRSGTYSNVRYNYFNAGQIAIYTYNGCLTMSSDNASSPNASSIGTLCDAAITIRRLGGQPSGVTAIINQGGGQTWT